MTFSELDASPLLQLKNLILIVTLRKMSQVNIFNSVYAHGRQNRKDLIQWRDMKLYSS